VSSYNKDQFWLGEQQHKDCFSGCTALYSNQSGMVWNLQLLRPFQASGLEHSRKKKGKQLRLNTIQTSVILNYLSVMQAECHSSYFDFFTYVYV
jgi:hypothetical protein